MQHLPKTAGHRIGRRRRNGRRLSDYNPSCTRIQLLLRTTFKASWRCRATACHIKFPSRHWPSKRRLCTRPSRRCDLLHTSRRARTQVTIDCSLDLCTPLSTTRSCPSQPSSAMWLQVTASAGLSVLFLRRASATRAPLSAQTTVMLTASAAHSLSSGQQRRTAAVRPLRVITHSRCVVSYSAMARLYAPGSSCVVLKASRYWRKERNSRYVMLRARSARCSGVMWWMERVVRRRVRVGG